MACEALRTEVGQLNQQLDELRKECEQLKTGNSNVPSDIISHETLDGVSIRQLLTAAESLKSENGATLDLRKVGEEEVAHFLEKRNNLGIQSKSEDIRLIVTIIGEHVVTLVREKGKEY